MSSVIKGYFQLPSAYLRDFYIFTHLQVWKEPNGAARSCTSNRQCPATHYCTPVTTWTGTVYQTKSLCCPSKNYVCSQPRDVGVRCSSTRITRYYFNADTKTCQTFEYNGCEGNMDLINFWSEFSAEQSI